MNFEAQLIEKLKKNNKYIGDDCAVFDKFVITTDALVEDIHFSLRFSKDYQIGYKTASVSLSDIASMGAIPKYFLLSLSLPERKTNFHIEFHKGFMDCLNKYNVKLIGGDTTGSKDKIYINGTAIGEIINTPVLRSGAKVGDSIYITKQPGISALGLKLLQVNKAHLNEEAVKFHQMPEPEVEKGIAISKNKLANAMQDVSDGISKDLATICKESNCGAEIDLEQLPLPSCKEFTKEQLINFALHGGEEYSLLFTSNKDFSLIKELLGEVYKIGVITLSKKLYIKDKSQKKELSDLTYKHF